jgi:hypothetical protein
VFDAGEHEARPSSPRPTTRARRSPFTCREEGYAGKSHRRRPAVATRRDGEAHRPRSQRAVHRHGSRPPRWPRPCRWRADRRILSRWMHGSRTSW